MKKQFIKTFYGNCTEHFINDFILKNNIEVVDIVIRESGSTHSVGTVAYGYVIYLAEKPIE